MAPVSLLDQEPLRDSGRFIRDDRAPLAPTWGSGRMNHAAGGRWFPVVTCAIKPLGSLVLPSRAPDAILILFCAAAVRDGRAEAMNEGSNGMPSQEEFDELKGRIVELENQLKGRAVQRDVVSSPRKNCRRSSRSGT